MEGDEPNNVWPEPVTEWIPEILNFISPEKYITLYSLWHSDPQPQLPNEIDSLIWDTDPNNSFLHINNLLSNPNSGQFLFSYFGHGTQDRFDGFYSNDMLSLNTAGQYPFFFLSACATGWFDGTSFDCIAETGVNCEYGVIGCIAASRSTFSTTFTLQENFYENLMDPYTGFVGEIVLAAKIKDGVGGLAARQYNLFADPGINLVYTSQLLNRPDFTFSKNSIIITPENPRYHENFSVSATVFNNSPNPYSGNIEVKFYLKNQDTQELHYIGSSYVEGINGWETKTVSLSYANTVLEMGYYTLKIKVDENNSIDEIIESNNIIEKDNVIISRVLPEFPVNFTASGITNNAFFYPIILDNNYLVGSSLVSGEGNILWSKNENPYFQPVAVFYDQWYIFECLYVNEEPKKLKLFDINGTELWQMNLQYPAACQPFYIKYGDDIYFYILAEAENGSSATLYYKNIDGSVEGAYTINTGFFSDRIKGIALNDLDNDGYSEMVFSYKNISNSTLKIIRINKNIFTEFSTNIGLPEQEPFEPVIFDYNDDGIQEIVLASDDLNDGGHIFTFQFNGSSIQQTGQMSVPETGSQFKIVTDLNGDGHLYLISYLENYIQLFDILNSTTDVIELDRPVKSVLLARITGNNQSDIIAAVPDWIYVINNGHVVEKYPVPNNYSDFGFSIFDSDNVPYLLYHNDKKFYVMDLFGSSLEIEWGQPYYNLQNSYSYPKILKQNIVNNQSLSGEYKVYNNIEIESGVVVDIKPGSSFNFKQDASFKIFGNLTCNGMENLTIRFKGLNNYIISWDGLEFYPITNCTFSYCQIKNADRGIYIKPNFEPNSTFQINHCEISNCGDGIHNVFNNVDIHYNNIHHNNTGIYISQSEFNIYENTISNNHDHGIYLYNSSAGALTGNIINGNGDNPVDSLFAAISLYNSSPGVYANQVNNNFQNGILLFNESYPVIEESNSISENGPSIEMTEPAWIKAEILMQDICVPYMNYGHNDIVDNRLPDPGYLMMHAGEPDDIILVNGNYWGGGNPESRLYPLEYFEYDGWDEEPNTTGRSSQGDPEEQLFISALTAEKQCDYQTAKTVYRQIIANYPDSIETTYSLKRVFVCEQALNGDFTQLRSYYDTFSQNTADSVNAKVAQSLVRRCMVQMLQLDPAIVDYETIVQNPPSLADSVYAVIDIGEIYLLQEELSGSGGPNMKISSVGGSSSRPTMAHLKPVNRKQFEKKKSDLLALMFSKTDKSEDLNIPET